MYHFGEKTVNINDKKKKSDYISQFARSVPLNSNHEKKEKEAVLCMS